MADVDGTHRLWRNSTLRLLIGPALLAAAGTLAACGGGGGEKAQEGGHLYVGPPGEALYQESCARCHGASLEGAIDAPALDPTRMLSLGDEPLRMTILFGKGRMPGFNLTDQELADIINFLRSA